MHRAERIRFTTRLPRRAAWFTVELFDAADVPRGFVHAPASRKSVRGEIELDRGAPSGLYLVELCVYDRTGRELQAEHAIVRLLGAAQPRARRWSRQRLRTPDAEPASSRSARNASSSGDASSGSRPSVGATTHARS